MKISGMTAQGNRPYQEDRYTIYKDTDGGTLLGVFDGHGGSRTADIISLGINFVWEKTRFAAFPYRMVEVFKQLHEMTKEHETGSTASLVYIPADKRLAHVAILGDSPVWIVDAYYNLQKSPEHNIRSNEVERLQAVERGAHSDGYYIYDFETARNHCISSFEAPGLQMSRALGDKLLDKVLNRVPECYPVVLGFDSKILIGTDGILDPAHNTDEQVIKTLESMLWQDAEASKYVAYALERKTGDNATAITVSLAKDEVSIEPPFSNVIPFPKQEEQIAA